MCGVGQATAYVPSSDRGVRKPVQSALMGTAQIRSSNCNVRPPEYMTRPCLAFGYDNDVEGASVDGARLGVALSLPGLAQLVTHTKAHRQQVG
jgi:hypothetical protein